MRPFPLLCGLLLVAAVATAAEELDPPILLLGTDPGTPIADVFRTFGAAEMRTIRMEGETRCDDLAYRMNEDELVIARFVDGALDEVLRARAQTPAPPVEELTVAELKRRGRIAMAKLGWTAEQMVTWLMPDAIVPEDALQRARADWKGGDVWVYRIGPYLTHVRVREGHVAEIADRLLGRDENTPAPRIASQ